MSFFAIKTFFSLQFHFFSSGRSVNEKIFNFNRFWCTWAFNEHENEYSISNFLQFFDAHEHFMGISFLISFDFDAHEHFMSILWIPIPFYFPSILMHMNIWWAFHGHSILCSLSCPFNFPSISVSHRITRGLKSTLQTSRWTFRYDNINNLCYNHFMLQPLLQQIVDIIFDFIQFSPFFSFSVCTYLHYAQSAYIYITHKVPAFAMCAYVRMHV